MNINKVLITGSKGQLGKEFVGYFQSKNIDFVAHDIDSLDITDKKAVLDVVNDTKIDVIINCAAYNNVDEAEKGDSFVYDVNANALKYISVVAKEKNILLVHYSSDYVFDGEKNQPYVETDPTNPLNEYGKSKLLGEQYIVESGCKNLIFRTSWVTGQGSQNFLYKLRSWVKEKEVLQIVNDEVSVPTFTFDIVKVTIEAIEKGVRGLYHLTNTGWCSRYELAKEFFKEEQITIEPVSIVTFKVVAKRPVYSKMCNEKISKDLGLEIPKWQKSLEKYKETLKE